MGRLKESVLIYGVLPLSGLLYNTNLTSWYRKIGDMLSWEPDEIKKWQIFELRSLIRDAHQYSPYYHDLFKSISLDPDDIHSLDDLKMIPPLTKDIIRERYDDILLKGKKGLHYRHCSTGGSTGNPTKYIKDNDSWGFDNAFNIHMWKQTGYHYGDRFLALGSSSIFPTEKRSFVHDVYYGLKGKMPFNAMNMSEERLEECVRFIKDKDVHFIYGYASSIFLLAKYVEATGLSSTIQIKACFPTSEILTDTYRTTIERVFNCPVSDMYGAHDGGIVAHNIKGGFKVGYNCIVQTIDDMYPGTALLTDVTNHSFPFIRYELGDELSVGDGYNSDYFNGQVLDRVIGRTSDIIRLENGRILTGPGYTILFSKLNIKGYRIYKSGVLEITIVVVRTPEYSENDDSLIMETMHKHAGDDCTIIIKYAESVETRKNGKNLFFLNDDN